MYTVFIDHRHRGVNHLSAVLTTVFQTRREDVDLITLGHNTKIIVAGCCIGGDFHSDGHHTRRLRDTAVDTAARPEIPGIAR